MVICQSCNQEIPLNDRKGRIYCNPKCGNRKRANIYYLKFKKDKKYRERRKNYFKNWYKKSENKEKIFKSIYKYYKNNPEKWVERGYVNRNKEKIWRILGRFCKVCGNEATEIHHKKYDFPKRSKSGSKKQKEKYLFEYCKFLEPLCKTCHCKINAKTTPTKV